MKDHSDCCSYHGCQYDEDDCPAVEGESEWSFIDEDDYDEGPH